MCFSASASFVIAAAAGASGVLSVRNVTHRRELPLAAAPLFFAIQQGIEGLLWLTLPSAPASWTAGALTLLFLFFANGFWPIYVPFAILRLERDTRRRRLIAPLLAFGLCIALYLLWRLAVEPRHAEIIGHHVIYFPQNRQSAAGLLIYLAATGLPLLLSSSRAVIVLGAMVFASCATAYFLYWQAFLSVWCFFAAVASAAILGRFLLPRPASAPSTAATL